MEPRAYIYSRYSSTKQGDGDTLRRQFANCVEFADTLNVPVDTSLRDHGLSGFTGLNRVKGALGSFLRRVDAGEIARGSYLLVDSMDRISREDETQVLNLLTGLSLAGIRVCNVSERHVLPAKPDLTDWIRVLVHASRAHAESAEKGRKVHEAHQESKRRAREEGRVWHRAGPTWCTFDEVTRKFVPAPSKVAVVRRVFDLVEQGLGTSAIAIRFNEEAVPTPREKGEWHHSAVLEIARNRAVLGEYQPKDARGANRASRRPADGEPAYGYYPQIVEAAQFARVQSIIGSRARERRGRGANSKVWNNLFLGFGVCTECGGRMGLHTTSDQGRWQRAPVLRCNNSIRGAAGPESQMRDGRPVACVNRVRFPYLPLERAIIESVRGWRLPAEPVNDVRQRLNDAMAEASDIRAKIENLLDLVEAGDKAALARFGVRQAELEAKEKTVALLRREVELEPTRLPAEGRRKAVEVLLNLMATAAHQELYDMRAAISEALRSLVDRIDFDPNGDVRVVICGGALAYRYSAGIVECIDLTSLVGEPDGFRSAAFTLADIAATEKLQSLSALT